MSCRSIRELPEHFDATESAALSARVNAEANLQRFQTAGVKGRALLHVGWVRSVRKVRWVLKGARVRWVYTVHRVHRVHKVHRVRKVLGCARCSGGLGAPVR